MAGSRGPGRARTTLCACRRLGAREHVGDRPAVQRGPGIALGDDLVAVHAHRGGVVRQAHGKIGHRLAERVQRQHRDLTDPDGIVGLGQSVGGAQRDVGLVRR